jgi:hypothetical protein
VDSYDIGTVYSCREGKGGHHQLTSMSLDTWHDGAATTYAADSINCHKIRKAV